MNLLVGAHLSIAGGYARALERIHKIEGNCLQIFSSSPRGWSFPKISDDQVQEFVKLKADFHINPVYFHASYLINLADEGKTAHLSKLSLISELSIAPKHHIKGSIIHLGSFKDQKSQLKLDSKYKKLIANIKEILEKTPRESLFIIENAGNKKIGQSLKEIAQIISDVDSDRVRVCLDTCHLYSAGHDLSSQKNLDAFLESFDRTIGIKKLELFHLNDSRDPLGSGRDRHENIGEGTIPIETFRGVITHHALRRLPFIIETPGFDNQGPDKKNLDIVKRLAQG